jgi:predicted SnoaL-like aldol condensation-catalyzing enzyme
MKSLPVILATLAFCSLAHAEPQYSKQEQINKEVVVDFYNKALNQKDFAAASRHLGDKYIQHNPNASNGPEGLKKFLEFLKAKFPESRSEIKMILVDGDYVMLRVHGIEEPGTRGKAIVDIFRLENGKIVEHWDSVQPIPEKALNNNTMF